MTASAARPISQTDVRPTAPKAASSAPTSGDFTDLVGQSTADLANAAQSVRSSAQGPASASPVPTALRAPKPPATASARSPANNDPAPADRGQTRAANLASAPTARTTAGPRSASSDDKSSDPATPDASTATPESAPTAPDPSIAAATVVAQPPAAVLASSTGSGGQDAASPPQGSPGFAAPAPTTAIDPGQGSLPTAKPDVPTPATATAATLQAGVAAAQDSEPEATPEPAPETASAATAASAASVQASSSPPLSLQGAGALTPTAPSLSGKPASPLSGARSGQTSLASAGKASPGAVRTGASSVADSLSTGVGASALALDAQSLDPVTQGSGDPGKSAGGDAATGGDPTPVPDAAAQAPATSDAAAAQASAQSAQVLPTSSDNAAPASAAPSRTVTGLASQIVQQHGASATRFDVTLDPIGLGKVNVSIEIGAKGELSARLSFQHAESADALASQSGALRQALQDAGFNVRAEDLTFQTDSQAGSGSAYSGGGTQGDARDQRPAGQSAAAFNAMTRLAEAASLSAAGAWGGAATGGLDIRI